MRTPHHTSCLVIFAICLLTMVILQPTSLALDASPSELPAINQEDNSKLPEIFEPGLRVICDENGICRLVPIDGSDISTAIPSPQYDLPINVLKTTVGYQTADEFSDWLAQDIATNSSISDDNPLTAVFKRYGLIIAALLTIIFGLTLNATPCVLPMIPINLAILGARISASSTSGERKRGLWLGTMYGIGQMLAFGLTGMAFVLCGGMFGEFTHTAWFNFAIAVIFIILGLSMLDIIELDISKFRPQIKRDKQSNSNWSAGCFALLLGGLGALLASACVAPVLLWVLVLSVDLFADGKWLGLFLPFCLGFGLGLPWPCLGAGIGILPKPGRWMNHIKVVFATIIFVCALYYGYLGGRILYNNSHSTAADCHSNANALTIINDNMEQAIAIAKERNCQILLDFWNLGCKNCLAMDATTFKNSNLISIINDNYVFIKINADLPQHQNLLKALNIIGLPTYIVAEPLRNEKENQQ